MPPAKPLVHNFENKLLSTCSTCGVVMRRKRGKAFFYSAAISGPWTETELPCELPPIEDPWKHRPLVMLDVETTGVDWTTGHIVEIALVVGTLECPINLAAVTDGSDARYELHLDRSKTFCSLVQPPAHSKEDFLQAQEAHHIPWDDARSAPIFAEVGESVAKILDEMYAANAVMCAYNADFDHRFVAGAFLRHGLAVPKLLTNMQYPDALFEGKRENVDLLDPCQWSRALHKYAKGGHKLGVVAKRFDLLKPEDESKTHRADFDAELALRVLTWFASEVPDSFADVLDFQRGAKAAWAQNFFGEYRPYQRKMRRGELMVERREEEARRLRAVLGEEEFGLTTSEEDMALAMYLEMKASKKAAQEATVIDTDS